jgi:hypothetical protein
VITVLHRFRFTKLDDDSEMFLHDIDLYLRLIAGQLVPRVRNGGVIEDIIEFM